MKLDQQNDADIEHLISVCKFPNYNEDMDLEESFDEFSEESGGKKGQNEREEDKEEELTKGVSNQALYSRTCYTEKSSLQFLS